MALLARAASFPPFPRGRAGKRITILSIDGGGFFAKQVTQIYLQEAPIIFSPLKYDFCGLCEAWRMIMGPRYSGVGLVDIVTRLLGDVRLKDTVTNVVIPAFDICNQQPVFFSSARAKRDSLGDPTLAQVCQGSSAAPTYLPAVKFTTSNDATGETRHFHLVDGGVVCNNPTTVAITQAIKDLEPGNTANSGRAIWTGFKDFLVLSLGTGEMPVSYDAMEAAHWGLIRWFRNRGDGSVPLIEIFSNGSGDMVDYNLGLVFGRDESSQNYLRIQTDALDGEISSLDNASETNMQELVAIAKGLLMKPATTRNLETGKLEPCSDLSTNAERLLRFALWLSYERRSRIRDGMLHQV
uniref:Patatin n=2 Tax=Physcomitrium patens TaxID=3218 RepID=A0A2K1JTZ5_PHYPA|nr:hypothetical protein PHYPA_014772 [Physcomitrium patens]